MMRKTKKGISPLIATVLLIGFAVALAAVVMTWGLDFIRDTADRTEDQTKKTLICASDLAFAITNVECFDSTASTGGVVTVDNRGQIDIVSVVLRIHKADGSVTALDTAQLLDPSSNPIGGVDKFEVRALTHGDIEAALTDGDGANKVEAIATVRGEPGQDDITCPQNLQAFHVAPPC